MKSGFLKLDSGSYLNIDHIISIEENLDGDNKGGTTFFTTDPTEGLIKYEDSRSPDKIIELIAIERMTGYYQTAPFEYKQYVENDSPTWIQDSGSGGDLGL